MAHDVFISYSSKDKTTADAVCAHLESRGIRCWYAPRDIEPGADWAESIISGLNGAKVMALIYTDNSNDSEQVLREVAYAAENGLVIVPFRLSGTKPADRLGGYIKKYHWLDAVDVELAQAIQKLGARCDSALDVIRKDEIKAEEREQRSKGGKAARIIGVIALAAAVIIAVVSVFGGGNKPAEDAAIEPEQSSLVSYVDEENNGIVMLHLHYTLIADTSDKTGSTFADAVIEALALEGIEDCEATPNGKGLGLDIYSKGEKTGFSLAFIDGDNAIVSADKNFNLAGLTGSADTDKSERLKYMTAVIMASYPDISQEDAEELALVMYGTDKPVHARSGKYELYCQVSDELSFTVLNNDGYNY